MMRALDGHGFLKAQIVRSLREDIESGVLRDGEALPSTREMAAEWDVSVFTVNSAMRVLADEGLVSVKNRALRKVTATKI